MLKVLVQRLQVECPKKLNTAALWCFQNIDLFVNILTCPTTATLVQPMRCVLGRGCRFCLRAEFLGNLFKNSQIQSSDAEFPHLSFNMQLYGVGFCFIMVRTHGFRGRSHKTCFCSPLRCFSIVHQMVAVASNAFCSVSHDMVLTALKVKILELVFFSPIALHLTFLKAKKVILCVWPLTMQMILMYTHMLHKNVMIYTFTYTPLPTRLRISCILHLSFHLSLFFVSQISKQISFTITA